MRAVGGRVRALRRPGQKLAEDVSSILDSGKIGSTGTDR
jgi:hypothetical protein